jgi:predicted Fe-Mo cluster-binding NifX family protein
MNIAFTAKGTTMDAQMDARFGRTEYFLVYNETTKDIVVYDNRAIEGQAHGAGPKTAQRLAELGADVLITGNGPGGNADAVLRTTGITMYIGAGEMSVQEAYDAYKSGTLRKL